MRNFFRSLLILGVAAIPTASFAQSESITHADWARMLAQTLGWSDALEADATGEQITQFLVARDRIPLPSAKARQTAKDAKAVTWQFDVSVQKPGAYLLKVYLADGPSFVTVDSRPSVLVKKSELIRWVDVATYGLKPGAHTVSVTSPAGKPPAAELVSGCRNIAPRGGWKADSALTFAGKTASLVRALGLQEQLPRGTQFDIPGSAQRRTLRVTQEGEFSVEVQSPGGSPIYYRVDGCGEQLASPAGVDAQQWREAGAVTLLPGEHSVTLSGSAKVIAETKVRLVARRGNAQDYVNVLERLGVSEGAADAKVSTKAARANLDHPAVRSIMRQLGLTARTPTGEEQTAIIELPTDRVPDIWAQPASPILPAHPKEDE